MDPQKIIVFLLRAGIIAIPCDAIAGIGGLGELSNELSFYFIMTAAIFGLMMYATRPPTDPPISGLKYVLLWVLVFLGYALVSGLANGLEIIDATFHDRSGLNKFATSFLVLVYGCAVVCIAAWISRGRTYSIVVVPVSISAGLCLIYSIFELANQVGIHNPVYDVLNSIVHSGSDNLIQAWDGAINRKLTEGWDQRLRSLSFEPPAFGNYAGLAWPWLLAGFEQSKGPRRTLHLALLISFTILIILAGARTGWMLLGMGCLTYAALHFVLLPRDGKIWHVGVGVFALTIVTVATGAGIYLTLSYQGMINQVITGTSVSDLSRTAYLVSALNIVGENPWFGAGLGQFAFNLGQSMPDWGLISPEIRATLSFPEAPWPNTFSIYSRLAAEFGILGLLAWIAIWAKVASAIWKTAILRARLEGRVPPLAYTLLTSIAAILVAGLATDTFRTPMIWITLGVAAAFITPKTSNQPD